MTKPNLSAVLTDADKEIIKTNVQTSKDLMPWLANLTSDERRKMRKTVSKREGYVVDVYNTSVANSGALPADFRLAEWTKDELLTKQLIEVRECLSSLLESVEDTILLLGNERIHQADTAYGFLKQSAKTNNAITMDIERIARQFEGVGRRKNVSTFNVSPNSEVEVTNVVTGKQLVNTGPTVLVMKAGADLANKLKMVPVTVNPGNAAHIPAGCTTIVVSNTSLDKGGEFSVKTK
jgi:hypothetical protein